MEIDPEVRAAEDRDWPFVESILDRTALPVPSRPNESLQLFVCVDDGKRVGVAGIEHCGDVGLLRSVAVEASVRGVGYGTELCTTLIERARAAGVDELYLLTTTAESLFADLGFERIDRAAAPEQIRQTEEFSDHCPDSATCMRLSLARTKPPESGGTTS